jgi:hypothetical protein
MQPILREHLGYNDAVLSYARKGSRELRGLLLRDVFV